MEKIHTIVTHHFPHLDEILGIWLLRRFGEEKFPGVSKVKVVYWDAGLNTPDGRTAKEYEVDGFLLIGVGRGCFNEHLPNGRIEEECAATLVAKFLGIEKLPELKDILRYTLQNDSKGGDQPFALATLIKLMHKQGMNPKEKLNSEQVMKWAFSAIDAKFYEQRSFYQAERDLQNSAEWRDVVRGGATVKVVSVFSDNTDFPKLARSKGAAVVIQKNSGGNVQIFANKKMHISLFGVAQQLRQAELLSQGKKPLQSEKSSGGSLIYDHLEHLLKDGTISEVPEWFFMKAGPMLLNGSITAPSVAPTSIPISQIVDIVCSYLHIMPPDVVAFEKAEIVQKSQPQKNEKVIS